MRIINQIIFPNTRSLVSVRAPTPRYSLINSGPGWRQSWRESRRSRSSGPVYRLVAVQSRVSPQSGTFTSPPPICQVLPPTNLITRLLPEFCAHDSHNKGDNTTNSFLEAIARVGEGEEWYGVPYEMWGEVPLQREKLLGLAQRSINRGKTQVRTTAAGQGRAPTDPAPV